MLLRLPVPAETLFADSEGRSVAVVGNARPLSERVEGAEIDGADLVIRITAEPLPSRLSHGARTDRLSRSVSVEADVIAARMPRRLVWMTPKRRQLPWRIGRAPRYALAPADWSGRLAAELGARPATGLMVIDLLARSEARALRLHGFDVFGSLSLSGNRTAKDLPHNFATENGWSERLVARDGWFRT